MSRSTRHAKLRSCSLRLPDCRNENETTVFAHAPSVESGRGYKSPDWWGAFACAHCHDIADGRKHHPLVDDQTLAERWLQGIFETQYALHAAGILKLK
jgi:hypothetical protein